MNQPKNAHISFIGLLVLSVAAGYAQDTQKPPESNPKPLETALNFGLRAYDTGQTCYYLQQPNWHERLLPVQSCAGVAAINSGVAAGSFLADRWLIRYGHGRWAHFQLVSAGGSGFAIGYTIKTSWFYRPPKF